MPRTGQFRPGVDELQEPLSAGIAHAVGRQPALLEVDGFALANPEMRRLNLRKHARMVVWCWGLIPTLPFFLDRHTGLPFQHPQGGRVHRQRSFAWRTAVSTRARAI